MTMTTISNNCLLLALRKDKNPINSSEENFLIWCNNGLFEIKMLEKHEYDLIVKSIAHNQMRQGKNLAVKNNNSCGKENFSFESILKVIYNIGNLTIPKIVY